MTGLAPLKRHYSAGPRHAYAYTYVAPAEVGPRPAMQLEFWVAKGRKGGSWVLSHDAPLMPDGFRPWRKVRAGHSHADKLSHSIALRPAGHARPAKDQCELYLQWARLKRLDTVSVFPSSYGQSAARPFGFTARVVDPVDYNGDTPEPETDDTPADLEAQYWRDEREAGNSP